MKKFSLVMILIFISLVTISCAHTHEYTTTVTAPTCTEKGYTTYTCSCGDTYTEDIAAKGHSYTENKTEPTCTEKGKITYTCDCGDSYEEEITAKGHSYTKKKTEPTCTEKGYTTYTCSCGDTYTEEIAAKGHSYNEKKTEPTCTNKGSITYTCSCGDTYTEEIAAKGHSYSKKKTEPTCTERGYTTYTCSCGNSYVDNYVPTKHSYSNYVCTKCGTIDKSNAYNYLLMWVKQNGKVSGDFISIFEYSRDHTVQYDFQYDNSNDVLSVGLLYAGDDITYTAIALSSDGPYYEYSCLYGNSPYICEAYGSINANTFTSNSPISCDSYYGNSSDRPSFLEYTRYSLVLVVDFMNDYFVNNIPGLSIADFGFENFD